MKVHKRWTLKCFIEAAANVVASNDANSDDLEMLNPGSASSINRRVSDAIDQLVFKSF